MDGDVPDGRGAFVFEEVAVVEVDALSRDSDDLLLLDSSLFSSSRFSILLTGV